MAPPPAILDLGRATFAATHARMLRIADDVRRGDGTGTVLLVEHDPVYTGGRATPRAEIAAGVVPIERGGRVTFHGPGQLVVYPIVRLPRRDVRAWLRALERFGVAVGAAFGLQAVASAQGTGVFAGGRKLMSIGVAIRHWINLHGIAINVDMDLRPFAAIRPCGLDPDVMSDLTRATGRRVTMDEARAAVRAQLGVLLGETCAAGAREAPR